MMSHMKKLSVAFYWHMHQPVYQLTPEGGYIMPWVRLHAVKDYLDMALWTRKFEKLKLNFNFVPVLLDSIIDYSENGAHDIHSRLSITPENELNREDKIFILNNFFDVNYQNMILPNEQYHKLYKIVQESGVSDVDILSNQQYSDLMALFNLAWIDPVYKNENEKLKKLVKKGKNYSLKDRISIIEIQREIIRNIIPSLKDLISEGKIEVTTSPYYHPILPILLDYKKIRKDILAEDELADLKTEQDAKVQTEMALDRVEKLLGKRPNGVWLCEQCISSSTLEMLANCGVNWTMSDERILSKSINFEFVHDFKGYLEEPYHLLKTYKYKTKKSDIKLIFRDSTIHNLISFEYSHHDSVSAANDLYDRIKIMQSKILSSPDDEHLLTIAMDGENCWENYPEDGNLFLQTLYSLIESDDTLETVLISDYMDKTREDKPLKKIVSGSSFNRNFKLWIDEPVKDLAWSYLKRARADLSSFAKREPNHPNIEAARKELYICEGSDWFWWYGEPNYSGKDNIFDYIFRTRLKNIYRFLELDTPSYLDDPLISVSPSSPSNYPKHLISPVINGKDVVDNMDVWNDAGCIEIPDGPVLRESKLFEKIRFGNDDENFYLKFHLNKYIKNNENLAKQTYQMYIYTRNSDTNQSLSPIRLINKTRNVSPISMEKFHNEIQIAIKQDKLVFMRIIRSIAGDMWVLENSKQIVTAYDEVLDLKIPFELLDVEKGQNLEFLFINANFGMTDFFIPDEMLLSVNRPVSVLN